MKKILSTFFVLTILIFAIDIDDIDPGDIYYINGGLLNDDKRVIVVRVSHSKGKIKVKADNGDTEWVYPSKLLTRDENSNTNTVMPFAILGGLMALGAENSSENRDADGGYAITAKNNCSETMSLAILYKPTKSDEWETQYWWEIKPDKKITLNNDENNKLFTKNAILYYYAKSTYGHNYEIDGYKKYYVDDKYLWMKELTDTEGTSDIVLNCK